jgi:DedD protein
MDEARPEADERSRGSAGDGAPDPVAWVVRVASFRKADNASALRERLRGQGYAAFIQSVSIGGSRWHRVLVGPEVDKGQATVARDEIRDEFDLKGMVVRHP